MDSRVTALEKLGSTEFDLLVIGGGIVGAGIAEAASAHGLQVALVDKGDFAGATSSASSKLIHGGLRYLRLGDIGLVREAHHERRVLMNVVAPHLVRRLPFLFPLYEDGPYRPWFVQTGIVVYSTLARAKLNGLVGPERAEKLVPPLRDAIARARRYGRRVEVKNVPQCLLGEDGDVLVNGQPQLFIDADFWTEFARNGFYQCPHRDVCPATECLGLNTAYIRKFGVNADPLRPISAVPVSRR